MKVIETLSAILKKHNIKGVQLSEVVEVKMAMEGVLADGTVVATPNESFEVGAELYVIDAEGNPQPAPDGEHTLDNGMVLVSVGGFITEVKEAEPAEEEMSADIAATIAAMDEQLTSIKNQLAEKETELASVRAELSEVKNNLNVSQAKATELSKQAAAVSVKDDKTAVVETAVNFSKKQTKNDTILKTIMSLKK
jgi:hypothetical protein